MNQEIIKTLIKEKNWTRTNLNAVKRKMAKKYGEPCPGNLVLLQRYRELLRKNKIKRNEDLERILITRPVRTLSGIAALTVLTKPYKCPGQCLYCPNEKDMPKSYLKREPAAQRAYLTKFDPELQVRTRLGSLNLTGHNTEKIELIILGGTFPAYPKVYQENFIRQCFNALNKRPDKNLHSAQKKNESAYHRCVGLSIETRPDQVNLKQIKWWRALGITRVELGVQTVFDPILKKSQRGHTVKEIEKATRLLKDWSFKVVYHIMPNLPGSNPKRDLETFKILFSDSHFQPDQVKIYPLLVLKSAPLYKAWKEGKYQPYSPAVLKKLLVKIKKIIPPYVRIIRLIRDIPKEYIIAGNKTTNLRQILQQEKVSCCCIRCREARQRIPQKVYYYEQKYPASKGEEYYLSFENKTQTILYAHLRLRFPGRASPFQNTAVIRELHTYGQVASLARKQAKQKVQHRGLGKQLVQKAESLAGKHGYKKIAVISGVGVRGYYRKLGYRKGKYGYMLKSL